jgi:hypothetical protein
LLADPSVLKPDEATVHHPTDNSCRFRQGRSCLARVDPASKEGEHALLLIRLFRALDSSVGNQTTAQAWLASNNHGLGGVPRELIRKTEGLVHVVRYLDASRARL